MREKLGESRDSIHRLNRPLEQATTSSLEALQTYSAALDEMRKGRFPATIPLWERAIEIDPNFAMAYYFLGHRVSIKPGTWRVPVNTRHRLSVGLTSFRSWSGHSIVAFYYAAFGELDKSIDAYQTGVRDYPRFWGFHNQLSMIYIDLGRYEDGLKEGLEARPVGAQCRTAVSPSIGRLHLPGSPLGGQGIGADGCVRTGSTE